MKRILFIYPPSQPVLREDRCPVPSGNPVMSPRLPPNDLMYLAAVAEELGYECRIRDFSGSKKGMGLFQEELRQFCPDMIVINMTSPTIQEDLNSCKVAKSILPDATIIAKGAHFLRYDREVMENNPEIDILIRGEAEFAFRELLKGKPLREITGLTWRGNDNVVGNPERAHHLDDIDSLPFPARHLVDNSLYRRPDNGRPLGVIRVSRGCPHHCFFCLASPVHGKKVRMRSVDSILDEIYRCIVDYEIRDFIFWSDLFNYDREWVMNLCDAIIKRGLSIKWSSNIRADRFDAEMAMAMKRAGCEMVSVGVESGNQRLLDLMGKGIRLHQYNEAFNAAKKAGLRTIAYYLFGLPWETEQTAMDTINYAMRAGTDFASFFIATPLPGTKFHDYVLSKGLLKPEDVTKAMKNAYYSAVVGGHFLSPEEINLIRKKAIKAFYMRPSYILARLRSIGSWTEFKNAVMVGISVFQYSKNSN